MNIGFDFDGVLAKFDEAYYKTLKTSAEIERYYKRMEAYLIPDRFGSAEDTKLIITNRNSEFEPVTMDWLEHHSYGNIEAIFLGHGELQDWSVDNAQRMAHSKADSINANKIDVYFEDNPYTFNILTTNCKDTKIILVKGGRL